MKGHLMSQEKKAVILGTGKAGAKAGNKGYDTAASAIEMVNLYRTI